MSENKYVTYVHDLAQIVNVIVTFNWCQIKFNRALISITAVAVTGGVGDLLHLQLII